MTTTGTFGNLRRDLGRIGLAARVVSRRPSVVNRGDDPAVIVAGKASPGARAASDASASAPAAAPAGPRGAPLPVPATNEGYLSPLTLWGCQRIPLEGRIILPGAAGAGAGVGTSATAVANASGLSVASSPTLAAIFTYTVPSGMIAVVVGYFAKPSTRLGYRSGHVTFVLDVNGRRTDLPPRLLGLRGDFNHLLPIHYIGKPAEVISLFATNGSTATWHVVAGALDVVLIPRSRYRRYVDPQA